MAAAIDRVRPGDPRYPDLAARNAYGRARGEPDVFYVTRSPAEVALALGDAVASGLRLAVRSGGRCHEDFVANDAVRAVIDTSLMTAVAWDAALGAFSVECGVTLGELYRTLFLGWGVMLPAGVSPQVGAGGHILGGGFGFFARQHGLAVDHLYAVEVAVVDRDGGARLVTASREPSDPHRELWWAHTGGGGGNFGIVTRYWLRSPGAPGPSPAHALPRPPPRVLRFRAGWDWAGLDDAHFARLVDNHGAWCEANSAPGSLGAQLYATLLLTRRDAGQVVLRGVCMAGDRSAAVVADYVAALDQGLASVSTPGTETLSWLAFALDPLPDLPRANAGPRLSKMKDAFLKRRFSQAQIADAYRHLTRPIEKPIVGALGLGTYGGAVNTVAPDATAAAQRQAVMTMYCWARWTDPAEEAANLAWLRALYGDLFRDSGGAPAPGPIADGCFINHPDSDMADPRWNRSGVAWHGLYYKDNYPRLQRVKARWDPRNIFRHALSITAP